MPLDPKKDIHATTLEGLAEYNRKRNRGNGGDPEPTLKEKFNAFLNEVTEPLRIRAKHAIRPHLLNLEDHIKSLEQNAGPETDLEPIEALKQAKDVLQKHFNTVMYGDWKDTELVVRALWTFRTPPAKNGPA
jgi:hypothetical protein